MFGRFHVKSQIEISLRSQVLHVDENEVYGNHIMIFIFSHDTPLKKYYKLQNLQKI